MLEPVKNPPKNCSQEPGARPFKRGPEQEPVKEISHFVAGPFLEGAGEKRERSINSTIDEFIFVKIISQYYKFV